MHRHNLPSGLMLILLGLTGCVVPPQAVTLPARRPLGSDLQVAAQAAAGAGAAERPAPNPSGVLTLRQALALALLGNPDLAAVSWDVRAAEARALQASLLPNPELEAEAEEVLGTEGRSGIQAAEVSLVLSQAIEMGGKRARRVRVAELEGELAGWDQEAQRLAVLTEVAKAFVEVLAAQERAALAGQLAKLAEQGEGTVAEKIEAGKESAVEGDKARVEVATSRIELARARRALAARRKALAALWGARAAAFERAEGGLDALAPVPPAEALVALVAESPEVARWATELRHREARLALERANAVADVTLSGGVQYFNEDEGGSFILGVGVPLPIFDRNQGGIGEARADLAKAREERRAADVRVHAELAEAYEGLAAAHAEATALESQVLPAAERAFAAAQEGYRQGKFGYLEVLDAQRTLFEGRQELIEALASYHKAVADVERRIGRSLSAVTQETK